MKLWSKDKIFDFNCFNILTQIQIIYFPLLLLIICIIVNYATIGKSMGLQFWYCTFHLFGPSFSIPNISWYFSTSWTEYINKPGSNSPLKSDTLFPNDNLHNCKLSHHRSAWDFNFDIIYFIFLDHLFQSPPFHDISLLHEPNI